MKKFVMLFVLGAICILWSMPRASAETIPSIVGIKPFTAQANFLSLAGYLRWQYYMENDSWITRKEADNLAKKQIAPKPKK